MAHDSKLGSISGTVREKRTKNPVSGAVVVLCVDQPGVRRNVRPVDDTETNSDGHFFFDIRERSKYRVQCDAFVKNPVESPVFEVGPGVDKTGVVLELDLDFQISFEVRPTERKALSALNLVPAGLPIRVKAEHTDTRVEPVYAWTSDQGQLVEISPDAQDERLLLTENASGTVTVTCTISEPGSPAVSTWNSINISASPTQQIGGQIGVTLQRSLVPPTDDMGLWAAIRTHSKALSFGGVAVKGAGAKPGRGYQGFIDAVLCQGKRNFDTSHAGAATCPPTDLSELPTAATLAKLPLHGMAAYELLKTATEIFLLLNCGVAVRKTDILSNPITSDTEEILRSGLTVKQLTKLLSTYLGTGRLPYIQRVVDAAFPGEFVDGAFCNGVLTKRTDCACLIELIWSYWHEEGMLAQSLNAISRRFQNVRGPGERDPLAHLEIDPLRPLNNLLWGYIQDEQNRLTVKRRAYEYDHHYGLTLYGKAIPALRSADSRSKFLEGFHNLLHLCSIFYKEDNDTTVIADGFPLLNGLKEVHLLLAQGAHNQFGDLPWTARAEMLLQQWLMARPEMRDFMMSRPMVPYQEAWMPQVDTMKTLQGWSDVTITHFRDLAVYGEQILLSVRYGDWIDINIEDFAKNWARYWRPEIQGYLHAYRAATGVDLTNPDTVDFAMPALHLKKRLALQRVR